MTKTTEQLIAELLAVPAHPLGDDQKKLAYEFAAGLFYGHVGNVKVGTHYDLGQLQAMRALSQKMTFYIDYFSDVSGRDDASMLGYADAPADAIARHLLDVPRILQNMPLDDLKQIASRSVQWSQARLVDALALPASDDKNYVGAMRLTVNYNPGKILDKAHAIRAYVSFYNKITSSLDQETDKHLADAKRALLDVHVGRVKTLAATDVYPALLSLEDQLTKSMASPAVDDWRSQLVRAAPAIGRIHQLRGADRLAAREQYAQHLDAIRQGAPLSLDDVDGLAAAAFSRKTLDDLRKSVRQITAEPSNMQPTDLAAKLKDVVWSDDQIKKCTETVLADWGLLSNYQAAWQDTDDRDGFAPDGKFQVIITPHRSNMSVDSTHRIVNVPEGSQRPLINMYPAGALPLIAHELSHVLQAYADYDLGQQIPLARIKGRRYRILREAGGAYQERIICRDYFGVGDAKPNDHYLNAYVAKINGGNRVQVARAFYKAVTKGEALNDEQDLQARQLAVNRTARLYRHGGHSSQALDYVEQAVVCDILARQLQPAQADALLLGSTSFCLQDSALLHRYGLIALPEHVQISPAHDVMRIFMAQDVSGEQVNH